MRERQDSLHDDLQLEGSRAALFPLSPGILGLGHRHDLHLPLSLLVFVLGLLLLLLVLPLLANSKRIRLE